MTSYLQALSLACCMLAVSCYHDPSLATLSDGAKLRGVLQPELGVRYFKGIPYAEPPVDERRWLPPIPISSWAPATRQAVESGANCPQHIDQPAWDTLDVNGWPTEDCLYLDVFTPYDAAAATAAANNYGVRGEQQCNNTAVGVKLHTDRSTNLPTSSQCAHPNQRGRHVFGSSLC